ncbi:MAG: hypothetical protein RIC18_16855 [Hoeflea sp.]|uniref:hypothetical protein n=1 Tax=Hoeflea sp. TaxID=1940281 RepID=UPI0032ED99CE
MRNGIKIIGALGLAALLVAGCNSTEQTLAPIPGDGGPGAQDSTAPIFDDPGQATISQPGFEPPFGRPSAGQSPSAASGGAVLPAGQIRGRIRFMPVIGAPVNAVTPLSRQLAVEARNRGLAILSAADTGGDHVLKGYFSAETFEGRTTVFYVWDILDASGARLHRIQGQEAFAGGGGGGGGDPWASVPADVMERIAARSIAEYVAWRGL